MAGWGSLAFATDVTVKYAVQEKPLKSSAAPGRR
jgi:hypothetical protein